MEGLDNCHRETNATCTDTIGSFMCNCSQGFTGNGIYCSGVYKVVTTKIVIVLICMYVESGTDIDECEMIPPCHPNANCSNNFGSFNCSCNAGYCGNGFQCEGM